MGEEQATFNTRLSKRIKNTLQRAADLRGQTLSEFVLGSAYERAVQTITDETIMHLSERDAAAFARAVTEPATVDETALKRFFDAHQKAVADDVT